MVRSLSWRKATRILESTGVLWGRQGWEACRAPSKFEKASSKFMTATKAPGPSSGSLVPRGPQIEFCGFWWQAATPVGRDQPLNRRDSNSQPLGKTHAASSSQRSPPPASTTRSWSRAHPLSKKTCHASLRSAQGGTGQTDKEAGVRNAGYLHST